jgi:hypothetical protein
MLINEVDLYRLPECSGKPKVIFDRISKRSYSVRFIRGNDHVIESTS